MGKFQGVLLAADYDDTLYNTSFEISKDNRAAIRYFVSEGGCFTVSTGRSLRNFSIQMEREAVPVNVPVILCNGANIYDFARKRMLRESLVRPQVTQDMDAVCRLYPDLGFEAYHEDKVYVHNPNEVTRRHLSRAGLVGIHRPILDMKVPWIKAIFQSLDHGLLVKAQERILQNWSDHYEIIFSNDVMLELTAKGIHKGSAVLWMAEFLGIRREDIYCIGNGQNDIPMLQISAEAFAPANCTPVIRSLGATIVPSCDENCVAHMIEHLDRRYPKNGEMP